MAPSSGADLLDFVETLPPEEKLLTVTHPGSGTMFLCAQLLKLGRPTIHEFKTKDTPKGAEDRMAYAVWPYDLWLWNCFDTHVHLVRYPLRVVYSMNALFTKHPTMGVKIITRLFGDDPEIPLPPEAAHYFNKGDFLSVAMYSVATLYLRANAWALPVYRIEDVVSRTDTPNHTHKPESATWERLFKRNEPLASQLLDDTLRFGYTIPEDDLVAPAPEITSLGSFL